MNIKFEINPCVCGKGVDRSLFICRDINFGTTSKTSRFLRCCNCGSLRPEFFPSEGTLSQSYSNYYTSKNNTYIGLSSIKILASRIVDATRKEYMRRNRRSSELELLDYGCGSGSYLRSVHLEGHKFKLFGVDILEPIGDYRDVFTWSPVDLVETLPSVDYVTFSHVVEHLKNPGDAIAIARGKLKTGGRIWISTPNAGSLLIKGFGASARDVDFPRHRIVFSADFLRSTLESSGFEAVTFVPSPRVNAVFNAMTCVKNVRSDNSISTAAKFVRLFKGGLALAAILVIPNFLRTRWDPELVVMATLRNGADQKEPRSSVSY